VPSLDKSGYRQVGAIFREHRFSGAGDLRLEAFSDSYLQTAQLYFLSDGGGACGGLFF
jgi:hypothetical protein